MTAHILGCEKHPIVRLRRLEAAARRAVQWWGLLFDDAVVPSECYEAFEEMERALTVEPDGQP